jgi:hypothetical protein
MSLVLLTSEDDALWKWLKRRECPESEAILPPGAIYFGMDFKTGKNVS